MTTKKVKRKLTAILSADVEGYSRLMGEDEVSTVQTLTDYREIMSSLIEQHRGRVVDSPGDNLLAEFGSVVDSVQCAVEIQEVLKAKNEELSDDRKMMFRIGVNLGDVIEEGDRIYGDGVNIAARIEGLAEAGGICISGSAHEQIKTKLAFGYEYIGEHSVKNIAEPLKVYRVPMGPKDVAHKARREKAVGPKRWRWALLGGVAALIIVIAAVAIWNFYLRRPSVEAADPKKMAFPLPDKPSIAVLPFDNLSGDPEQEYIADGISENIIATLSKVSQMFVIARNSTFTYKGKPVQVQQVAEEQGVRYVLEGSVQKSGDQLRVTAQLIDAIKGHHLWSEKYDRELKDFFVLQDVITKKIVVSLRVEVETGGTGRVAAKSTDNFEAWTNVAKGLKIFLKFNKEDNLKARALFEAAIKLDPEYAVAWAHLAVSHRFAGNLGWSNSRAASMKLAHEYIQKALALDDKNPQVRFSLGGFYLHQRQLEKAISEYKMAISLDPNFSPGYQQLARAMTFMGEFEESITLTKKAMRLSPYYSHFYLLDLGPAYFFTGRYEEAIATYNQLLDRCRKGECPTWRALAGLAMVNAELGKLEEARKLMAEALENNPKLSLDYYRKMSFYKDPAHLQRKLDVLIKAGLPDKLSLPLPDKPSIAVLPFVNMSGDPEQEYFSDGITEDIITDLSKVSGLFLISRNSSFLYKGKKAKIQDVARDLGVQYVLEGSVRRSGDRVRITAQLIDGKTEHHVWADRYDRELKDIFSVQDEVTQKVVAELAVTLKASENERLARKHTENFEAYEMYLRARRESYRLKKENHVKGIELAQRIIELDPNFAGGYSMHSFLLSRSVQFGFSDSPREDLAKAFDLAQKAVSVDDTFGGVYVALASIYLAKRQHDEALAAARAMLSIQPGSAGSFIWLGYYLHWAGRGEEAVDAIKKARQLNPKYQDGRSPTFTDFMAQASFTAGSYEESIAASKETIERFGPLVNRLALLAAGYGEIGKEEEARATAQQLLKKNPKFSLKSWKFARMYKNSEDTERMLNALRKAGLK